MYDLTFYRYYCYRKQSNEETEIFRRLEEKYLQWNSVDTFNTDVPYLMSSMKTEEESIYGKSA